VHRTSPVTEVVRWWGRRLHIPVRHFSKRVRYCGDFYGAAADGSPDLERVSVDALIRIISSLQPGVTEVLCHAGDDLTLATAYREQRRLEVMALTDPSIKRAIREKEAKLVSFATYPRPRKKISWIDRATKMFLRAVDA